MGGSEAKPNTVQRFTDKLTNKIYVGGAIVFILICVV